MAQNVTVQGASYSDVPALLLPKVGGGSARFDDTSDADATASDILSGKTAYVNGVKLAGTIATKTSSDLTVSGAKVSVPSGYYASSASKTVSGGTAKPPSTISATGASVTSGRTTLTLSKSVSVTPTVTAGYISAGTARDVDISLTASVYSRDSSDLNVVGDTVYASSGYYASQASTTVASGTEGTPTATKGTVSNHSVSVTPSVTNTAGYISGGTKTGTAVSVSASELVSGNKEITSNGTGIDVADYSTVSVDVSADPSLRELTVTPTSAVQVFYPSEETLKGTITYSGTVYGSSDNTVTHSLGLTNGNLYRVDGSFSYSGVTINVSGTYACGTVIYSSSSWELTLNTNNLIVHNYLSRYDGFTLNIDVYSIDEYYDGFSKVTVNAASGGSVGTKTVTNSSATNTSLSFSGLNGEPKAFFARCLASLSRNTSNRHYYVVAIRYNGTNTDGNRWNMYNGQLINVSSSSSFGYSFTYSNGTLTLNTTGSQTTSPGSFYNGDYELVYIY